MENRKLVRTIIVKEYDDETIDFETLGESNISITDVMAHLTVRTAVENKVDQIEYLATLMAMKVMYQENAEAGDKNE